MNASICLLASLLGLLAVVSCHAMRGNSDSPSEFGHGNSTGHGYNGKRPYHRGHGRPGGHPPPAGDQHHHYYYAPVHKYMGGRGDRDHGDRGHDDHHAKRHHGDEHTTRQPPTARSWTSDPPTGAPHEDHDHGDGHKKGCGCMKRRMNKVWNFAVGDNYGPYEYIDYTGRIQGFHVDLIEAVCQQAGKRCEVILDFYENCWRQFNDVGVAGEGILAGWYDGCVGLSPSNERMNSLNFSRSFSPNSRAGLYYLTDNLPQHPENLTDKRIGFVGGWAIGKNCLKRQLGFEGAASADFHHYDSHQSMVIDLQRGAVDAIVTSDSITAGQMERLGMKAAGPWFECTLDGPAMMARKDSEVIGWWNEAFEEMLHSNRFTQLCEKSQQQHAHRGKLNCVDP